MEINTVTVTIPALDAETRTHVDTETAAYHLMRKPQTLRIWAMASREAPIRPVKIFGRLAWAIADIKKLRGGI